MTAVSSSESMSSAHAPTPRAIRITRHHGVERHGVVCFDTDVGVVVVGMVAVFIANLLRRSYGFCPLRVALGLCRAFLGTTLSFKEYPISAGLESHPYRENLRGRAAVVV
jgi:hypothetical protein